MICSAVFVTDLLQQIPILQSKRIHLLKIDVHHLRVNAYVDENIRQWYDGIACDFEITSYPKA